ncbi:MAG: glycosyltransferase family 2 protein [Candidatus Falkowbacteria bacterium]
MSEPRVIIVLPAYNAEKTLRKTVNEIPREYASDVILVDDFSNDNTVRAARELNLDFFVHEKNLGYGGNQKTCYKLALEKGADIVVMLHPDYQYDPKYIPYLVEPIKNGHFDIMLGSRITSRKQVLAGGMPIYKYLANRFLTLLENIILGLSLSEFHTGYRAYSRRALETMPFINNSNNFVFDSQILIQAVYNNLTIGEVFVPTKYFSEASIINFKKSLVYGLQTLWALLGYILAKLKICQPKIFNKSL